MGDTQHNGEFHLERIGKDQVVICAMPSWVQTQRIYTPSNNADGPIATIINKVPSRVAPDMQRLREYIVVDEAGINGESSHKENDVTTTIIWTGSD
jgi:hypothetical protein